MTMKNIKFLTLAASALLLTSACTPTIAQRGNMLEDYQIEGIVVGVHTRSDALRILGSPTTQAPFDDNVWYYIGQKTEKRGILDPKVKEERIFVLSFDEKGVIRSLEETNSERIAIPIERSKTQTHGNEITVIQQLLGNVGRFSGSEGTK